MKTSGPYIKNCMVGPGFGMLLFSAEVSLFLEDVLSTEFYQGQIMVGPHFPVAMAKMGYGSGPHWEKEGTDQG